MKRLLSVFLAFTLLLALAVVPASADEATGAITPDTSWFSKDKEEYEIGTAAEFLGFLELAQTPANFYHKTVRLTADIDLNPGVDLKVKYQDGKYVVPAKPANVWKMIKSLQGTLDGNGHVLSGIYFNSMTDGSVKEFALIYKMEQGGSIRNLIIENSLLYVTGVDGADLPSKDKMKIGGFVYGFQSPSVLENIYLDLDVCYRGDSTNVDLAGVSYWSCNGGISLKNIVYAGSIGGVKSDNTVALTSSKNVTQLMNYLATGNNMDKNFDNIALIGTYLCGDNGADAPVIVNADDWKRVQGIKGDGKGPVNTHIVSGRFDSLEAAAAAGKYYNFKNPDASLNTETDMTYISGTSILIAKGTRTMWDDGIYGYNYSGCQLIVNEGGPADMAFYLIKNVAGYTDENGYWICEQKEVNVTLKVEETTNVVESGAKLFDGNQLSQNAWVIVKYTHTEEDASSIRLELTEGATAAVEVKVFGKVGGTFKEVTISGMDYELEHDQTYYILVIVTAAGTGNVEIVAYN